MRTVVVLVYAIVFIYCEMMKLCLFFFTIIVIYCVFWNLYCICFGVDVLYILASVLGSSLLGSSYRRDMMYLLIGFLVGVMFAVVADVRSVFYSASCLVIVPGVDYGLILTEAYSRGLAACVRGLGIVDAVMFFVLCTWLLYGWIDLLRLLMLYYIGIV